MQTEPWKHGRGASLSVGSGFTRFGITVFTDHLPGMWLLGRSSNRAVLSLEIETPALDADPLTASREGYAAALSETAYYTRVLVLPPNGSPIFNFRLLSTKLSAAYLQELITSTLELPPDTPLAALSIDKEIIGLADIFAEEDDTGDQDRSASLERYCRLNFGANHCLIVAPVLPEELPTDDRKDVIVDIFIQGSPESVSIPLIVCPESLDNIARISASGWPSSIRMGLHATAFCPKARSYL